MARKLTRRLKAFIKNVLFLMRMTITTKDEHQPAILDIRSISNMSNMSNMTTAKSMALAFLATAKPPAPDPVTPDVISFYLDLLRIIIATNPTNTDTILKTAERRAERFFYTHPPAQLRSATHLSPEKILSIFQSGTSAKDVLAKLQGFIYQELVSMIDNPEHSTILILKEIVQACCRSCDGKDSLQTIASIEQARQRLRPKQSSWRLSSVLFSIDTYLSVGCGQDRTAAIWVAAQILEYYKHFRIVTPPPRLPPHYPNNLKKFNEFLSSNICEIPPNELPNFCSSLCNFTQRPTLPYNERKTQLQADLRKYSPQSSTSAQPEKGLEALARLILNILDQPDPQDPQDQENGRQAELHHQLIEHFVHRLTIKIYMISPRYPEPEIPIPTQKEHAQPDPRPSLV